EENKITRETLREMGFAQEAEDMARRAEDLRLQLRGVNRDVLGNRDLADTVRTQLYKEQTAPLMEEIDRRIAEIEALEEVDPDRFRAYAKVLNTLREIRAEIVG